ncbi:MAG: CaiB/BaiF CoA transferase family protein [Acidimicrobiia bacterium]
MAAPLVGVVVVEAANYVSGPFAGMMLADLGATVIKVEPPGGDPFRRFRGARLSAQWAACNRGKRSVVADLKTEAGVTALLELVDGGDVFLSNWRPDVADRLGVGDAVLAARNERLIRLWITGWGSDGPAAGLPAFDTVVQAHAGLIDATSMDGRPEVQPGYPVDKAVGAFAVQAIVAALFAREKGGGGERIDLAMLDVVAYYDFPDLLSERVFVDEQPADAHSRAATANRIFPASDGYFVLAPVSGSQIKGSCAAVGHPEWAAELFAEPDLLMENMHRLLPSVTMKEPLAVWLERFTAHDVPVAACLGIDEHLEDPQVLWNDIYAVEDWPGVGSVRTVRHPAVAAHWGRLSSFPAPVIPGGTDAADGS